MSEPIYFVPWEDLPDGPCLVFSEGVPFNFPHKKNPDGYLYFWRGEIKEWEIVDKRKSHWTYLPMPIPKPEPMPWDGEEEWIQGTLEDMRLDIEDGRPHDWQVFALSAQTICSERLGLSPETRTEIISKVNKLKGVE